MEPEKKSNGAFIGLIVIIIILILGGIYIWESNQKMQEKLQAEQTQSDNINNQDATALDALQQDSTTTNTNTGVDANIVN